MALPFKICITLTILNLHTIEVYGGAIQSLLSYEPEGRPGWRYSTRPRVTKTTTKPTLPPCEPETTPAPFSDDEPVKRVRTRGVIDRPLTGRDCRTIYRELRACGPREVLEEAGRTYLCASRDTFNGTQESREGPRRGKRSIFNPCSGTRQRVAVLLATDMDGNLRELVTDPANFLYQTIIIEECGLVGASSFLCQPHDIVMQAAVFSTDPDSNDIFIEDVSIPAYCALSSNTDA